MARMTLQRAAALAVLLLALAGCSSNTQSQSAPKLTSLGLRLSDLPAQTTMDSSQSWPNTSAARRDQIPVALYQKHGRLLSYEDSFTRNVINGSGTIWLLHASSEITAFRQASGARWYFHRLQSATESDYVLSTNNLGTHVGQTGIQVPFRRLPSPSVSEERAAFTANWGGDEFAYTTRVILFQRGRYVVLLHIIGLQDQTVLPKVVAVARTIDDRVTAAAPDA